MASSFAPSSGFDLEAEFEVVGILHTKDDWKNTLFLPPQTELDLSRTQRESLLGQYLLDNDRADDFLQAAEAALPPAERPFSRAWISERPWYRPLP